MRTFLWVVLVLNQAALLLLASLNLKKYQLSEFAAKEAVAQLRGEKAKLRRQLYKKLPQIQLFWQTKLVLAGALSVVLWTQLNRPVQGMFFALLLLAATKFASRLIVLQKLAVYLFERGLKITLKIVETLNPVWLVLGTAKADLVAMPASKEEFISQLQRLPGVILPIQQRQQLERVLAAENKTVKDIMTPKKHVVSVEPSATLGPILLSDLQKSGHGYFPVAAKKAEPQGVLALHSLTDLKSAKQHSKAKDFMDEHVIWADEDSSLEELVQKFLGHKQYVMFVKNKSGEFGGLVTIADVMQHVLGIVRR